MKNSFNDFLKSSRKYIDLSTEQGFQFKFLCETCDWTFSTEFQPYKWYKLSEKVEKTNFITKHLIPKGEELSEQARLKVWQDAHDKDFVESVKEIETQLIKCPNCFKWVCRQNCWKDNTCYTCFVNPQTNRPLELISCPLCGSGQQSNTKFCTECGSHLAPLILEINCSKCGTELQPNAQFCSQCGNAI